MCASSPRSSIAATKCDLSSLSTLNPHDGPQQSSSFLPTSQAWRRVRHADIIDTLPRQNGYKLYFDWTAVAAVGTNLSIAIVDQAEIWGFSDWRIVKESIGGVDCPPNLYPWYAYDDPVMKENRMTLVSFSILLIPMAMVLLNFIGCFCKAQLWDTAQPPYKPWNPDENAEDAQEDSEPSKFMRLKEGIKEFTATVRGKCAKCFGGRKITLNVEEDGIERGILKDEEAEEGEEGGYTVDQL